MSSLGEVVNNAMELIEQQSKQLHGVLPKDYTMFSDELLSELLRIFNNSALDDVGGDIIGRIYEYFLNKFAKNIAQDDGVFFTPKSLVKMIVNVLEPTQGVLLDPACGSGGMFVQTGDFVEQAGMRANNTMTFFGQEKVEYNAKLCLMNLAVHGLAGVIKSGDEANTFYHDAHNLEGSCDYVMANPPFNVDKVKAESAQNAGRLPFGLPAVNKNKEIGNANYLWISYFYAYLNERGRAGFVMASSATDSQSKDKDIREKLVQTGHVDVMVSVGNNFFYTRSLPCTLWFFDKGKKEELLDKVLFIDARNYYTVVDRTLNEWSEWQLKNLNAIVWLYRGETDKYESLIKQYFEYIHAMPMPFEEMGISAELTEQKNLLLKDLDDLIQERLDALLFSNPQRINYYERYQAIIEEYNSEQDRATIEKTFMDLIDLARSMDHEEQRYVREGFSSDEELSMYDLLFSENLSKQDIRAIKKISVELLAKVKAKIAELDHWRDKEETRSAVDALIRDTLWKELPPAYDNSLNEYRRKIYEYVYIRYPYVA